MILADQTVCATEFKIEISSELKLIPLVISITNTNDCLLNLRSPQKLI